MEKVIRTKCPICGKDSLVFSALDYEVPYFGKVLLTNVKCDECGYKHSDVFSVEVKEPSEVKFRVLSEEDLMVRVVKSSNATIEIPELGIKIEPGPASEAYISNVEGVLIRIEEVLKSKFLENKKKVKELLKKIKRMREGKGEFTLIIKDPTGNSAIGSERTEKRRLSKEEIESLKTSVFFLDAEK